MALPKVGVEAVIEGMAKFEADSKKVNQSVEGTGKAIDNMAAKAAAAGLKFDEASGRWRRATGQFASDAELAALGIKKAGDSADTASHKFGGFSLSLSGILPTLASLGASLLKIGVIAGGAALAGVAALSAGLATFAVGGIKQAIDLDQQVANIAATMGATKETAGTLKDELKGLALDLSLNPNLTVDVTQAGEAIEVLAANGALATDEFGKLTEASKDLAIQTVALANATGSDFTTAATIATDAMALFGLKTDEMGKAVDGAAGIMNASKFSAQDYQLALSNAGGIAAEMGITIEDFNTVLAGTASNFASGSDAGTSFKVLMQRLANPTDEVKAAMQQYGISLFDANGEMRSMADIAQDLNQVFNGTVTVTSQVGGATKEQAKAAATASASISDLTRDIGQNRDKLKLMTDVYQESLKFYDAGEPRMRRQALAIQNLTNNITDQEEKLAGYNSAIAAVEGVQARTITSTQQLTEAQKAQLAATLGGADGARILLGLADLTAAEFDALSESVNRSGQGMEAAALRVDTVKGAMDIFKGVLQAIQIQVGDQFLPLLKGMAVQFTQFATENGPMIVGAFGQIADSIAQMITRGQELFAVFQSGGTEGLVTALGLGSLITMWATIQPILNQIATWFQANLPIALSIAQTAFNTVSAVVMSFVNTIVTNVWPQLQEAFANITVALNNMGLTWGDVFTALGTAAKIVASVIGIAILAIIGTITGLVTGFAAAFATISGYFVDFQNAISQFVSGIGQLFTGLVTIISGLLIGDLGMVFEGVKQQVSGLFDVIGGLGSFLLTTLQATFGSVFSFVRGWMSSFLGFFDGLAPALGEKFENTWDAIREVWKPEKWFELGESVITGILEGIKKNQAEVLEMLKGLAASALSTAMSAIGASSPSKEFMTVGESMVQGMLLGAKKENFTKKFIDDLNMGGIARSLGTGGGQWRNFRNIIKNQIGGSFEQLMTSGLSPAQIIKQIQDVAARFNFPPSFASEFAMANGLIEHLTSSVTEFQKAMRLENMGRMAQIGGQFSSIGQSLIDMLKPVDKGEIQTLQDFLSGKTEGEMFRNPFTGVLEEIIVLQREGYGIGLNRVLAQQKLDELLQEQLRQEKLITEQKEAQQKLSFLQAQIDLIKLGKELGGNIFRGITFGLNASVTDLLAATNNVVEAMVNQINSDLQIASPSKVMAGIGQQMMAGLQRGIVSMTPVLNAQLSASVAGPLSPAMAGAMNSNSYSTTNIFNTGGNTISNGMNAAEFEARVLQVIRRNL